MYYVVYETISLFGSANVKHAEAFKTLEEARIFAKEIAQKGSPGVRIAQEMNTEEKWAN
ncbi:MULTISPECIES: hypothetical protein [Aneurinibacillus]|uniref:Uncharacterized protein n=1 Tax=Aneurinibacillus thermoaerophilus TaxID=143495 RepID=A0A1G7XCT9_ANETH|nr:MULTISPECIES: hypothetical protein [Aneurinibacillus]MED0677168.1 hypothetical protein [Aneurinibacillus thermoaerophilus]MED0678256.1 hypothetical protein [Aneurinibacillus thermoaerophilus]MED0736218.1 hypothetical protein [Aneurinibacillus thermoaerophilus]MED0758844.1 hypothetical protein [Aneurinibacillus thermoaerophilus]MED0760479.1 hypothetical protein [Aneurinibacillus thermoaerophilus]